MNTLHLAKVAATQHGGTSPAEVNLWAALLCLFNESDETAYAFGIKQVVTFLDTAASSLDPSDTRHASILIRLDAAHEKAREIEKLLGKLECDVSVALNRFDSPAATN